MKTTRMILIVVLAIFISSCGPSQKKTKLQLGKEHREQAMKTILQQYPRAVSVDELGTSGHLTIQMQRFVKEHRDSVFYVEPIFDWDIYERNGVAILETKLLCAWDAVLRIRCNEALLEPIIRRTDRTEGHDRILILFRVSSVEKPYLSLLPTAEESTAYTSVEISEFAALIIHADLLAIHVLPEPPS